MKRKYELAKERIIKHHTSESKRTNSGTKVNINSRNTNDEGDNMIYY